MFLFEEISVCGSYCDFSCSRSTILIAMSLLRVGRWLNFPLSHALYWVIISCFVALKIKTKKTEEKDISIKWRLKISSNLDMIMYVCLVHSIMTTHDKKLCISRRYKGTYPGTLFPTPYHYLNLWLKLEQRQGFSRLGKLLLQYDKFSMPFFMILKKKAIYIFYESLLSLFRTSEQWPMWENQKFKLN